MNGPHAKGKTKALIKADQQKQVISFQKRFIFQKYHLLRLNYDMNLFLISVIMFRSKKGSFPA